MTFKGNWGERITSLPWRNLVTMAIQIESRKIFLLPCEEYARKIQQKKFLNWTI